MRRFITYSALFLAAALAPAASAQQFGKLSGTVVDPSGIPQMGATVALSQNELLNTAVVRLLTNDKGSFLAARLAPGIYTIRVTLAGFLPAMERNVRIEPNLTTILKIEMGTIFSSLDTLRRKGKGEQPDPDEWAWVLRTSASTRAILRFAEGEATLASEPAGGERAAAHRPTARVELTAGARRPGSVSNIADAPSTAIAYEQAIGLAGRMTFAGQASYERSAAVGFATAWLPSGEIGRGPETTLVLRQANLGPARTPFRGVRLEHNNQLNVGRLKVNYGAEYLLASVGASASSLRPNAQIQYQINSEWRAALTLASRPWMHSHGQQNALQAILEEMDAFPTVLMRDGRPVMEGGWHQEISVERRLGGNATLTAGFFRDRSSHTALFGRGLSDQAEFLQDFYSDAFAYDGGGSGSLGSRVAYRKKLSDGTEVVILYSWAGALVPSENPESLLLRDALDNRQRHSVAGRISTRLPKAGTQLTASYKWLSGPVASRHDAFGEVAYQVDPFLNFSVRQPLPGLFSTKIEALADFRNLLAQGYVPVDTADGRVVLIPAFRTFRGGFSFQF